VDAAGIEAQAANARSAGMDWACFAGLSHGELIDGQGRKLLGTCQWRGRWGVVLSGGLLLGSTPWEDLEFIHYGVRPERSGMRNLASGGIGGPLDGETLRREIERSLTNGWMGGLNKSGSLAGTR
jgi:hypothetical protein